MNILRSKYTNSVKWLLLMLKLSVDAIPQSVLRIFCCSTGPYKVNGVPLRRIAQAYVIATNTKVDLSSFKLPERLTDDFFKREPRKKKRSEDMFEDAQEVMRVLFMKRLITAVTRDKNLKCTVIKISPLIFLRISKLC